MTNIFGFNTSAINFLTHNFRKEVIYNPDKKQKRNTFTIRDDPMWLGALTPLGDIIENTDNILDKINTEMQRKEPSQGVIGKQV